MVWSPATSGLLKGSACVIVGILIGHLATTYNNSTPSNHVPQENGSSSSLVERMISVLPAWPSTGQEWKPPYKENEKFTANSTTSGIAVTNSVIDLEDPEITRMYPGKPRVRREWRTIEPEVRLQISKAFRIMVDTPTRAGRETYGEQFWNYKDLSAFHVCNVVDPRCDQGHFGPNFMTFHIAFILRIEKSLLAISEGEGFDIEALPYWDPSKDSIDGTHRNDPEKWIFGVNFFGDLYTKKEDDYQVTNGLFANWPVAEYTDEAFGRQSDMLTFVNYNHTAPCIQEQWFRPSFPKSKNTENELVDETTGLLSQVKIDDKGAKFVSPGQGVSTVPPYCPQECQDDWRNCPRPFRLDHYDCNPNVTRTPSVGLINARLAGGTSEIIYSDNDRKACLNPDKITNWMEWQNCIEKRIDGLCEVRPMTGVLDFVQRPSEDEVTDGIDLMTQFTFDFSAEHRAYGGGFIYDDTIGFTNKSGQALPGIAQCGNPTGFYDDEEGRHYVNCLHAMMHIRLGNEMFDTGTSANDVGPFTGHHNNVMRSNLEWRMAIGDQSAKRFYDYPHSQDRETWKDTVGEIPYGTSGPYGTYDMSYCLEPSVNYRYRPGKSEISPFHVGYKFENSPWINGTLLDDIVSEGMPHYKLFDGENADGGELGYTHKEILYYTMPERTPYTYDTLMHHYVGHNKKLAAKCESFDNKKDCSKYGNGKCDWTKDKTCVVAVFDSSKASSIGVEAELGDSKEHTNSGMALATLSFWALLFMSMLWFQWE